MKKTEMLADSIAQRITEMIEVEGRFAVGDKLPNENDLAQELGVSVPHFARQSKFLLQAEFLK